MSAKLTLKEVNAPTYALDGSQGFQIAFERSYVSGRTGEVVTHGLIYGWAHKAATGEVWATVDASPYFTVGTVAGPLTEAWVWEHADSITA